jgi:ankyrin repeat protein
LQAVTNPIYKHAPEEYFPASPALDVARAVRADDVAALDKVFAQHPGLDPNQEGQKGVTFLFWAYAHHHVKMLKALVARGADPNRLLRLPNEKGGTDTTHLLNIAAEGPKDELLVALLELGADPNVKDERKVPALLNAVYINNYTRMKILLDHGADIDAVNSAGATAVATLASLNNFEQVYYLLERGADWRKSDGEVALWTQENDIGNAKATQWQIKVKHLLMAKGVKFPVPSSGAKRYAAVRERWEQTPEGRAWRVKLDALGAQPDVVGKVWTKEELAARTAMRAWMQREGIPMPPL